MKKGLKTYFKIMGAVLQFARIPCISILYQLAECHFPNLFLLHMLTSH